jgi:hypothetical protein
LTTGIGVYRPIRIWLKIWQKLLAAKKNGNKKADEKNIFLKMFFHQ